jgi:hypothetical protein
MYHEVEAQPYKKYFTEVLKIQNEGVEFLVQLFGHNIV